ncbi:MAG: beta-aspartyl-peptidase [Gammaproteobacteria bacterium]|nr:beta-aspartyl-peptidase [Gammaproteobacteria bacterium]
MFLLLKNANVFSPFALGMKDILIAGERIAAVDKSLCVKGLPALETIDLSGCSITPGFVDGHVHLTGGGGEGGYQTRTPEVMLSTLTKAGITTVVGLLGTDCITRHPVSLFAKAKALTADGISAYMLTGGYQVPACTITGSVSDDVALIDIVIGLKTAVSDHRSSHPSTEELIRLASQARVAGMLANKAGRLIVHIGGSSDYLAPLEAVIEQSDIPVEQLLPTHVNRSGALAEHAMRWLGQGGFIDITAGINPEKGARNGVKPSSLIHQCVDNGLALERVCLSSDGNGSIPDFSADGRFLGLKVAGFGSLLDEFRVLLNQHNLPVEQALIPLTKAPSECLGLSGRKGGIEPGKDADLLVFDSNMQLRYTIARGQIMVCQGQAVVHGQYETTEHA